MVLVIISKESLSFSITPPTDVAIYVDQSLWQQLRAANSFAISNANGFACFGECFCCLLLGFPFIFFCHPCIAASLHNSQLQKELEVINAARFGGFPVFSIDSAYSGDIIMNTNYLQPIQPSQQIYLASENTNFVNAAAQINPDTSNEIVFATPVNNSTDYYSLNPNSSGNVVASTVTESQPRTMIIILPQTIYPFAVITATSPEGTIVSISTPPDAYPDFLCQANFEMSELRAKLERRRSLNGEVVNGPMSSESAAPVSPTCISNPVIDMKKDVKISHSSHILNDASSRKLPSWLEEASESQNIDVFLPESLAPPSESNSTKIALECESNIKLNNGATNCQSELLAVSSSDKFSKIENTTADDLNLPNNNLLVDTNKNGIIHSSTPEQVEPNEKISTAFKPRISDDFVLQPSALINKSHLDGAGSFSMESSEGKYRSLTSEITRQSDVLEDFLLESDSFLLSVDKEIESADYQRTPSNSTTTLETKILDVSNPVDLQNELSRLRLELIAKDSIIKTLQEKIAYLNDELAKASNLQPFDLEPNSKQKKPSMHERLKKYGFDVPDTVMVDFIATSSNPSAAEESQLSYALGAQLTPSATKQLNDLLNIDSSIFSQRYSADLTSSRMLSSSSISMLSREPSQRFLDPLSALAEEDTDPVVEVPKSDTEISAPVSQERKTEKANPDEMQYKEFIELMLRDECSDIVVKVRKFMLSIMGPAFDGKPPPRRIKVDYIFYGTKHIEKRCRDFFDEIQLQIRDHPLWRDESEERVISSRDCLESYVMTRLHPLAFAGVSNPAEDAALLRRMKILSFLSPENLDMSPELRNEALWLPASLELRKIDTALSPGDKIDAVVNCAAIIFKTIEAASKAKEDKEAEQGMLGADDFLPVFIFVVLRSQLPRLYSNCNYIQAFLNPIRLMSQKGYCLVNLQSALEFIMNVDADTLNMDREEFASKLAAAEKAFPSR